MGAVEEVAVHEFFHDGAGWDRRRSRLTPESGPLPVKYGNSPSVAAIISFGKSSTPSRLGPLIHYVHSFGVAFGNLSPFGRLWSILPNSGLVEGNKWNDHPAAGTG